MRTLSLLLTIAALACSGALPAPEAPVSERCGVVRDIVRNAPAYFTRIRGTEHHYKRTDTLWTDPVKLPGAAGCSVYESESGGETVYSCFMRAASCEATQHEFEDTVREFSSCFGKAPRDTTLEKRRTAVFYPSSIEVRLILSAPDSCGYSVFVDPTPMKGSVRSPSMNIYMGK